MMEVKDKVQPSGAWRKKQRHSYGGKMYKRLPRQEMPIADKSFGILKRREEVR